MNDAIKTKLRNFEHRERTLFARRKIGQRTMPENNSEDIGIVIKSISLLMKT
jgi:hypothetical protein